MSEPLKPKINLAKARHLLGRAVLTQGHDFVYQDHGDKVGCLNVPFTDELGASLGCDQLGATPGGDGWPAPDSNKRKTGCVVGTALSLGGVPVAGSPASSVWTFEPYLTRTAVRYFKVAQMVQDGGLPWGAAWEIAETWADYLVASLAERGAYPAEEEEDDGVCEVAENSPAQSGVGVHGEG